MKMTKPRLDGSEVVQGVCQGDVAAMAIPQNSSTTEKATREMMIAI